MSTTKQKRTSSKQRIRKNARVVSFFTFLSRILGAVRDLVMLHVFGAGAIYDAFIIALTIPNVLRRLTAEGSLSMVFVPLYTDIKEQRGIEDARLFTQKVISLVIVVCTFLCAFGIGFSDSLVQAFASGFEIGSEKYLLTVSLTEIMFSVSHFYFFGRASHGGAKCGTTFCCACSGSNFVKRLYYSRNTFFYRVFQLSNRGCSMGSFSCRHSSIHIANSFSVPNQAAPNAKSVLG